MEEQKISELPVFAPNHDTISSSPSFDNLGVEKKIDEHMYSVSDWWNKFVEADILEREEMVSKMGIVNNLVELSSISNEKLTPEMRKHLIVTDLTFLFSDAVEVLYHGRSV